MLVGFLCGVLLGIMIGYVRGMERGLKDGIKVARVWEGFARDYRMMLSVAIADTEEDEQAAVEIRELEKMYDDV